MNYNKDIFLIRHAHPDIPLNTRFCLGSGTDTPLGILGKMQACALSKTLHFDSCYASNLSRSYETASFISDNVIQLNDLREVGTGLWDGLDFEEIKVKWPEEYAKRENDRSFPIPEGENLEVARARFAEIADRLPVGTAIVAHDWIIRLYTGYNQKIPYCGYLYQGEVHTLFIPQPTPDMCKDIRKATNMLPHIVKHCDAVSTTALDMAKKLNEKGMNLDLNLIECSCLVHDIARLEPHHESIGAAYLDAMGWCEVADVVRQHAQPRSDDINEAAILSMADKITMEDQRVTIAERFSKFHDKAEKLGLLNVHELRIGQAYDMRDRINSIIGYNYIL